MTSIDSFVAQQNASGRGANGIGLDYSAVGVAQAGVNLGTVSVPSGQNAVIGFQSAAFTSGVDTVVLDGPRSSYVIQVAADGTTTIKDVGVGDATVGKTVTVTGESYIVFNGANLAASMVTVSGAPTYPNDMLFIQNSANAQLAEFYAAILQRTPDLGGLEYWQNQLAHGGSIVDIAQSFISLIHSLYGTSSQISTLGGDPGAMTNSQYIAALYQNILGRQADSGGLAYWVGQMDAGLSQASALVSFTSATASISAINAMPGASAGSGSGWLVTPSLSGGYADPGLQVAGSTVLAQATLTNNYNLSLIDPTSIANVSISNAGVDILGPTTAGGASSGSIWLYSNAPGSVVSLAASFTQLTANNSGNSIHDGPGSDVISINGGSNNFITLGAASSDLLHLANGTNSFVFAFAPGKGSVLEVSGTLNGTAVTLLDGTTSQIRGSSLSFGSFASSSPIMINIGSIGGGTALEVATAANKAYAVSGFGGSAAAGTLGEHLMFIGTDAGGNAEIWSFRAPLSVLTVNGVATLGPVNSADVSGDHMVETPEITLIATVIGVPAAGLHAADLA